MQLTARRSDSFFPILFAAAFCLLPFAAGCGGEDSSSDDQSTTAAAPPPGNASGGSQPPASQPPGLASGGGGQNGNASQPQLASGGGGGEPSGDDEMEEEGYGGESGAAGYGGAYGGSGGPPPGRGGASGGSMLGGSMLGGGGMAGGGYPGAGAPGQQQPQKPARPEAFADWTKDHFEDAVRERDEKVLAAIQDRVSSRPGDSEVAVLLTGLLAVSMENPQPANPGGGYGPGSPYGGGYEGYEGEDMEEEGYRGGSYPPGGAYPGAGQGPGYGAPPAGSGGPMLQSGGGSGGASSSAGGGGNTSIPPQSRWIPQDDLKPHETPQRRLLTTSGLPLDGAAVLLLTASPAWVQQPPQLIGAGGSYQGGSEDAERAPGYGQGLGQQGYGQRNQNRPGNLQDRELVTTIVSGLMQNGSQEAWQTLHGLLSGQVQTPLEAVETTEIVTAELFRQYKGSAGPVQQTLLAIIDGSAPLPPENRTAAVRMVAAVSTLALNKLTGFVTETAPAQDSRQQRGGGMIGYGGGTDFGSASGIGGTDYGSASGIGGTDFGSASGIGGGEDEYGAGYGAGAGPGFGGGPAAGADVTSAVELPAIELNGDQIGFAAALLWGPQVRAIVAQQLQSAASLDAAIDPLTLATSMPHAEIRHAEFSLFSRLHATGADPLVNSGVLNGAAHDPAVLLALKALPRERPSRTGAPEPADSWTVATQQLVYALRDELRKAAPGLPAFPGAFPVRLHRDAVPEVAVMVTLPGPAKDFLGSAAPAATRIYYTRTMFTPKNPRDQESVKEHYEKRATGFARADLTNGILWIDGVKTLTGGERRAMDVIVEKADAQNRRPGVGGFGGGGIAGAGGSGLGGAAQGGGTFSIEVIVVEAIDPKTSPGDAALSSADGG